MPEKHTCHLCGRVGHNGAQWILETGNRQYKVHKPCGQQLVDTVPKGTVAKLIPSPELRHEWTEKKRCNDARQFWSTVKGSQQLVQLKDRLPKSETPVDAAPADQSVA
jgi:hypothetical protein